MRIGLFAHRLAKGDATGIGRYYREFTTALAQLTAGEHTVVLSSTPERSSLHWVPPEVELRVVGWPRRPVQAAWVAGAGPHLERATGRLDVVHLLFPFPPLRSRAPQLVTVHDVLPLEQADWYPRSEPLIFRRTIELVLRRAHRVVVPSEHVKGQLSSMLDFDASRIVVVPLGVSSAYLDASRITGTCARFRVEPGRYAVSVGAVSTRKNLVPVIRALSELGNAGIPLLLVGPDGHGTAEAEAEIARLGNHGEVRRTGYLPDEDVAALVKGAAVLIHPALAEGFGFVPLEAMAAGTPVIAARVASIPEVVGEAGVLVEEPHSPSAWAAALRRMVDDREHRNALARAGRERAAAFGWERVARTMLKLYQDGARG